LEHDAHTAGGLQAKAGVVTERRNINARLAASVDEQRPRGSRQRLSIDYEVYVCHQNPYVIVASRTILRGSKRRTIFLRI
jgi:hypothetical protein